MIAEAVGGKSADFKTGFATGNDVSGGGDSHAGLQGAISFRRLLILLGGTEDGGSADAAAALVLFARAAGAGGVAADRRFWGGISFRTLLI